MRCEAFLLILVAFRCLYSSGDMVVTTRSRKRSHTDFIQGHWRVLRLGEPSAQATYRSTTDMKESPSGRRLNDSKESSAGQHVCQVNNVQLYHIRAVPDYCCGCFLRSRLPLRIAIKRWGIQMGHGGRNSFLVYLRRHHSNLAMSGRACLAKAYL